MDQLTDTIEDVHPIKYSNDFILSLGGFNLDKPDDMRKITC